MRKLLRWCGRPEVLVAATVALCGVQAILHPDLAVGFLVVAVFVAAIAHGLGMWE